MNTRGKPTANNSLFFATVAFAIAFANWGLIAGLAPLWRQELGVSLTQASIAIAVPVLLGSLGRLPVGIITDRFGGRVTFSILLAFGIVPTIGLAANHSYLSLLFWGFWLGLAGTSFAIGVGFVSRWFPPEKQGAALGIYGIGNIGQSFAVFFGPVLAGSIGIPATFILFGLVSLAWGAIFALWARNAETEAKPKTFQENIQVLRTEPFSWVFSLFYALTFGGFVALSIYLPTLLKEMFSLTPADAGARAALFVVVATLSRPIGGWLSDRIGGQQLLAYIFGGLFLMGWLMAIPSIVPFTVGASICAVLLGLGNGGVFKLVPQYFPQQTGTVTGLVGAAGGLGGFFPPILLGILKDLTGSYAIGFVIFSLFALTCEAVLWRTFLRISAPAHRKGR